MIILRYIRRELLYTVITVTAVLTIIALSNQIAGILGKAVHGEIAKSAILYIVAFSSPYFIALLLPIGVFAAAYLVFTRLYSEQEMVILQMSGVSKLGLLKIIVVPLLLITIFATFINLWLMPAILRYRDVLMDRAQVVDAVTMLAAGHFQVIANGRYVVYVQSADVEKNSFSHIFVAERPDLGVDKTKSKIKQKDSSKNRWNIFLGKSGGEEKLKDYNDNKFIVIHDGYQYQGLPGKNDFYQMKFSNYGFEVPQQNIKSRLRGRAKSTSELWRSNNLSDRAELQSRINLIVAPIVLTIVALAFSTLAPRQTRFVKLLPAVIVVLIYYNLMLASTDWLARGYVPMFMGAWWLHLTTIAGAGYMLFRQK